MTTDLTLEQMEMIACLLAEPERVWLTSPFGANALLLEAMEVEVLAEEVNVPLGPNLVGYRLTHAGRRSFLQN